MRFLDLNLYELANAWIGLIAATAALAVFALVLWLMLRVVPKLDLKRLRKRRVRPRRRVAVSSAPLATPSTGPDVEWQAINGVAETRFARLQAISTLQGRAGQCIEAAEYALDRLLADCAAVMLKAEDAEHMQRRRAAIAGIADPSPAPASKPLAA